MSGEHQTQSRISSKAPLHSKASCSGCHLETRQPRTLRDTGRKNSEREREVRRQREVQRDKRDRKGTERHRGNRDRETESNKKRTTIDRGKITRDRVREAKRWTENKERQRNPRQERDPLLVAGATHT